MSVFLFRSRTAGGDDGDCQKTAGGSVDGNIPRGQLAAAGTRPLALSRLRCAGPVPGTAAFGLVEVLMTLLLCSVGILNLVGLHTVARQANHESMQRTTAVMLARDMAAKMRANRSSLAHYLTGSPGLGGSTLSQPTRRCTESAACSGYQTARHDMWLWEQALDGASERRLVDGVEVRTGGLVSPTACISGPATASSGVYTITLVWRGLHELKNLSADRCGMASDRYGSDGQFRRILSFITFIRG